MKKLTMVGAILALIGTAASANAASYTASEFKLYNSDDTLKFSTTSFQVDMGGCVNSMVGSKCDRIIYSSSATAQGLMDELGGARFGFKVTSSGDHFQSGSKWLATRAHSTMDCEWNWTDYYDSDTWYYWTGWYDTTAIARDQDAAGTLTWGDTRAFHEYEDYHGYCKYHAIPDNYCPSFVYPIMEVQYKWVGSNTWFGKQFGVFLP